MLVGLVGFFTHGALLKNLRFADAGDHIPVGDLDDSWGLGDD